MNTQCRGWAVLVPVLFVAHAATAGGLAYVDSSLGLQTPVMEGGRTELEFGDVNGDRHPDIVCIGDHGSPYINSGQHGVMVWFGDGAGQWSVFQYGDFGYGGVALGDVNNDGLMDVGYGMHHDYASGDFGDQLLEVALGDGTGMSWTPWDDGLATNGETWGMFGTDFADVDNDGDLDVGSISFGCCAGIHVYLNNGDGTWIQSFGFVGGNSDMVFVFGDVNGDGLADIAASHGDGTVYVGDGQGGFNLADDNLPGASSRRPGWAFGREANSGTGLTSRVRWQQRGSSTSPRSSTWISTVTATSSPSGPTSSSSTAATAPAAGGRSRPSARPTRVITRPCGPGPTSTTTAIQTSPSSRKRTASPSWGGRTVLVSTARARRR
jgi:hypothetical protein